MKTFQIKRGVERVEQIGTGDLREIGGVTFYLMKTAGFNLFLEIFFPRKE